MTVFQYITRNKFSRFFILTLAFAVIFKACRPDLTSEIGSELQPDDEFIGAHFNNTHESLRLVAYTIEDLPGMTSGRTFFALGSFNDPNFGTVSIDLITQIDEMFRWDTVQNIYAIDSVTILFTYLNVYPLQAVDIQPAEGHSDPITISIGELREPTLIDPLTLARAYFSNEQPRGGFFDGSVVSGHTAQPNLRDSVTTFDTIMNADTITRIDTITLRVPTLRIPLHGTHDKPNNPGGYNLARRLLEISMRHLPRSAADEPSFLGEIPGLYFRSHPETSPGRGNIVNFDFTNNVIAPQIRVYYRFTGRNHDDSADSIRATSKLYSVGFWDAMTYNYVRFDRPAGFEDKFEDPIAGRDRLFLQAFFGTLVRVEMPDIRRLSELAVDKETGEPMRMGINQASLVLNPSPNGDRRFAPIPSLGIGILIDTIIHDNVMNVDRPVRMSQGLRDHGIGIGGGFVERRNEYRIMLTRHIQHLLLDPDAVNHPLTIFPANRLLFPDISAVYGPPESPTEFYGIPIGDIHRMRLEVVYSLLPK